MGGGSTWAGVGGAWGTRSAPLFWVLVTHSVHLVRCINQHPYDWCLFKNESYTSIEHLCKKPNFCYGKSLCCASPYINSLIPHNSHKKAQWFWTICDIGLYKFEIPWCKIIINYCFIHKVWHNSNHPNFENETTFYFYSQLGAVWVNLSYIYAEVSTERHYLSKSNYPVLLRIWVQQL